MTSTTTTREAVNHPPHYGGGDNPYEHIKVCRAWGLNYELGNATKYICRAGKKSENPIEDLKKAAWYIKAEIERLEEAKPKINLDIDISVSPQNKQIIIDLIEESVKEISEMRGKALPTDITGDKMVLLNCATCGGACTIKDADGIARTCLACRGTGQPDQGDQPTAASLHPG